MIKVTMLATLFAGIAMGTNTAYTARPQAPSAPRDTKIIVELDRSLDSLTSVGVKTVQKNLLRYIKTYVTSNVKLVSSYTVLNNAIAISVNNQYVDTIKSLPGVKSVTVNKLHWVTQSETRITDSPDETPAYGGSENASAVTMKKPGANESLPGTTNEGEGTVIAILDNEFYFRAKHGSEETWKHETFSPLDESVKVRWTSRPDITKTHVYTEEDEDDSSKYRWKDQIDAAKLGEEGSLYLNNKVPYYFDYGGDKNYYGGDPDEDFDVSSTISYHGSHVASIAAGNADTYKGIAPKAQLVCMKVFTNFDANKIDQKLGFGDSSGAYDIPILNALEDCITLGVDGINMSLGSNLDDFDADSITMKTLTKLANEGILSAISAGNAGKQSYEFAGGYGNWTSEMVETGILSGYANGPDTMTIASGQPEKTFYSSAFKYNGVNIAYQDQVVNVGDSTDYEEDEEKRISDLVKDKSVKTLDWVYVPNFGDSGDYAGLTVTDKIAVVNRGNIDFWTKVTTAHSKGAIGIVIINNDPTANDFNFRCSFGEGNKPKIPVALVLFKEKKTFEQAGSGTFGIVKDEVDVNPRANTISTFSSDGATYDLDLKPEITAPGDYIRGAVPPQSKEDKLERKYTTYEFLSGTSMSAPNYAGAQSVVLSKKAVELKNDKEAYVKYRNTVDMRLMSTAEPMYDYDDCPEQEGVKNKTSPRMQGAGMANIGAAYNTDVYLEGYNLKGQLIGKSKIALRNNKDINSGKVSLSFMAHNEGTATRTYEASYTVMRPAIKQSNDIVSRDYNNRGEIDSITKFSGLSYWVEKVLSETETVYEERHAQDDVNVGDVFKVIRDIKYNVLEDDHLVEKTIPIGKYVCTEITEVREVDVGGKIETWKYAKYEDYEGRDYQSTQDYLIATVDAGEVTVAPGDHKITLKSFSLTNEQRQQISEFYKYGCYLEGFVTLKSKDNTQPSLSMPWMGFYGGGNGQDYNSAPVVEPFNFEKDGSTVYPSELVNDIAKSLLGKSEADMGSTWATTYVEPGKSYNEEQILQNDESLTHLAATSKNYHLLGTDTDGKYYDNPSQNLYVGNPHASNTMLIQQFVLRSVDDNYFTIKNKATGKVVYKDVLKDMLFGDRYGRYPLYKSHVDENYLGGGYVCHRAFAVVPLYNLDTGESFPSGDYEIKFNYLLAGTQKWVSKSYTLHVVADEPLITSITNKKDSVRFNFSEKYLDKVKVGTNYYELSNAEKSGKYIELSHDEIEEALEENFNEVYGSGRLFIELSNKAYGKVGAVIRFGEDEEGIDFSDYTMVQHHEFTLGYDFEDLGTSVIYVIYDSVTWTISEVTVDEYVRVRRSTDPKPASGSSNGCGGNIATTSALLATLAGALAIILIIAKKRKLKGGKE